MSPLLILAVGMAVVIGGVLVLRLHAFLALILGTLAVGGLTSHDLMFRHYLRQSSLEVVSVDGANAQVKTGKRKPVGDSFLLRDTPDSLLPLEHPVEVTVVSTEGKLANVEFRGVEALAGDRLISANAMSAAKKDAARGLGARIAAGFGSTCGKIGILIAMAAIIGKCLLDSGAAERVVIAARNLFGARHTPLAFLGSGFVVGIPVFFDTVFYLLLPLGKAMRVKTGKHYLLYVLTIVAGATMAHSLVPPTPGPLFVAGELGVDLGLMMIGGLVVGLCTIMVGFLYAKWADARWEIPLRPSAELTDEELAAMANRDAAELPPLWASLMPIILPVVLIAGGTAVNMYYGKEAKPDWATLWLKIADKNIALCIAAAFAICLYVIAKRPDRKTFSAAIQNALASGGVIILITAAGGAFGLALRDTGIAEAVRGFVPQQSSAIMWLAIAFGVTSTVRIAQGSATVAMITAVGIIAPIAVSGDLGFHPLYLALAIGCGSKPIPWMNDSGFWLISRMSGMTEAETLKTASIMMSLMGIAGLVVVMVGATVLPLQ
ncbi:MAG: GntP family permease [Pirellulales bacterium]|nr:GntP family permease [Pirellulales bacterium]